MRARLITPIVLSFFALVAVASPSSAQTVARAVCADENDVGRGQRRCSHHGGVDAKATSKLDKAVVKAEKKEDKAVDKADTKADKAEAKADKAEAKADREITKAEAKDATAGSPRRNVLAREDPQRRLLRTRRCCETSKIGVPATALSRSRR